MKIGRLSFLILVFVIALAGVTARHFALFLAGPFPGAPLTSHADLPVEYVDFTSKSGVLLKGSLLIGEKGRGAVVLLHGYSVNRNILARRARFLYREGYNIFMFDFQAHGQSGGEAVTLGYRESYDVEAAMEWVRKRFPEEKIAIVATSMGAASVMARGRAVEADAYVLEGMYYALPLITERRLRETEGPLAAALTPLVLWMQRIWFEFDPWAVVPGEVVSTLKSPVLFIGASNDQYVTLAETQEMFKRITAPKELWIIEGFPHGDFSHTAAEEYEVRVLQFLENNFRQQKP